MMPSALVIDDHPEVRGAATAALLKAIGFDDVRVVATTTEALIALRTQCAHLVLVDLGLADLPRDAAVEEVVTAYPATRVLVMSSVPGAAERALLGGAHGFIDKNEGIEALQHAVRAAMSGYAVFPHASLPSIRRAASSPSNPTHVLSRRELTVIRFLAAGHSNKAISAVLGISNKTVSSHKMSIMTKLGFQSLIDLAEFARRHQLVG